MIPQDGSEARESANGSVPRTLFLGIAAGLTAGGAVALVDRALDPLISDEQRRRERSVRPASPHRLAGPRAVEKVTGRTLDADGRRYAQLAFSVAYGVGWGLLHAAVRRRVPETTRLAGLPFGIGFFLACDGVIAPLLGLTPTPLRLPWQPNAKELANHVAWTVAAEMVHRGAARLGV